MVQGLNWNNYSASQIVELKNNGVEVPDEVYKNAEAALSKQDAKEVTAQGNDNKEVKYTVQDMSGNINEAELLADDMEKQGLSLRKMVKEFTNICRTNQVEQLADLVELNNMVSYVTVTEAENEELERQIVVEENELEEFIDDFNAEVEKKEKELTTINDKIEDGTATQEEETKAEELGEEINEAVEDGNGKLDAKEANVNAVKDKALATTDDLGALAQNIGKKINKAGDSMEISDKTGELSKELNDIGRKTALIGSAFSIFGLGATIAGIVQMKTAREGMAAANALGNAAGQTISTAQVVAEQNDIAINSSRLVKANADEVSAEIDETDIESSVDKVAKNVEQKANEQPAAAKDAEDDENKKQPVKKEV